MIRLLASAIISVGLFALASCSSEPLADGPLEAGGGLGTLCIPAAPDELTAYGDVVSVASDAKGPVTLNGFDMDGVDVQQVSIVPIEESGAQGSFSLNDPPEVWSKEKPAEDVKINPGESINIVAVFPARENGTLDAKPLEIEYTYAGRHYVSRASTEVEIRETCS